jgi:hypothetical protein
METRSRVILAVLVGIVVALPLPFLSAFEGNAGCVAGPVVATEQSVFTPVILFNSPTGGSSTGSVITHNGSEATTITYGTGQNGSVIGFFNVENWTIYSDVSHGFGAPNCSGLFSTTNSTTDGGVSGNIPAGGAPSGWAENFSNDSTEPTNYLGFGSHGPPLNFSNQFYSTTFTYSNCGSGATSRVAVSNHIEVSLGFESGGAWHAAEVTINVQTTYLYHFPANGGTWQVDNLSAPGGPGGGWAFSYLGPC